VSKLLSREGVARVTNPVARAFLHAGFTADGVTIIATAARGAGGLDAVSHWQVVRRQPW